MGRLVEVKFGNTYSMDRNILTAEQLKVLQAVCSKELVSSQLTRYHINNNVTWVPEKDKEHVDAKIYVDKYDINGSSSIVNLDSLLDLQLPIMYSIVSTIKEVPERAIEKDLLHMLMNMQERLEIFDKVNQLNYKVGVHISDLGLLSVREVTMEQDACTDDIQKMLDDGWRILAVCPQPDQRRPDYILGRNKHD